MFLPRLVLSSLWSQLQGQLVYFLAQGLEPRSEGRQAELESSSFLQRPLCGLLAQSLGRSAMPAKSHQLVREAAG